MPDASAPFLASFRTNFRRYIPLSAPPRLLRGLNAEAGASVARHSENGPRPQLSRSPAVLLRVSLVPGPNTDKPLAGLSSQPLRRSFGSAFTS